MKDKPMSDAAALASANWPGAAFCATRCYPCQFDECPGEPHTWGSPEDFAHAWATFQDAPGFCGCDCGRPKHEIPKMTVLPHRAVVPSLRLWLWSCPLCASGTEASQHAAVTAGVEHRTSGECGFRRFTS
jgi:hypothetical protein